MSLSTAFIMPGTIINHPIYDKKGNLVLDAKVPFTESKLEELKEKKIERVYYQQKDNSSLDTNREIPGSQPNMIQQPAINLSAVLFKELTVNSQQEGFLQITKIYQLIDLIIKDVNTNLNALINLVRLSSNTIFSYAHLLNVTVLSIVIAKKHGFEESLVRQIGIGAFLHDLGKFKLPNKLVNKTTKYTKDEYEELKTHTTLGFEMIRDNPQLTSLSKKIILLHHEAVEGSGYPLGLTEKEVGYYPYVISISNIFDNLTTNRTYRAAYSIKDVLMLLIQSAGKKNLPYITQFFIKNLSKNILIKTEHPLGSFIVLDSTEIGQIVAYNKDMPNRPKLRIVKDDKGTMLKEPYIMDLKTDTSKNIKQSLPKEIQKKLLDLYPPVKI